MWESVQGNLNFAWILSIITTIILSLLTGYYFHRISLQRRELAWSVNSVLFVDEYKSRIPKLDVKYEGNPVERLSSAKVLIWNRGNQTIYGKQLDPDLRFHLRIEAAKLDRSILDVRRVMTNSEPTECTAQLDADGNRALVTFRYLEPQKGAAFYIVHTGNRPSDIRVAGEVIDTTLNYYDWWDLRPVGKRLLIAFEVAFYLIFTLISVGLIGIALYFTFQESSAGNSLSLGETVFTAFLIFTLVLTIALFVIV